MEEFCIYYTQLSMGAEAVIYSRWFHHLCNTEIIQGNVQIIELKTICQNAILAFYQLMCI